MYRCVFTLLLATVAATASADATRFAGEAQLRPPDTASADGRFSLDATLKPAPVHSTNGRFSVNASLRPDAKSLAGTCGNDSPLIFSNGFEN
jgi:hypothetical protein